MTNSIDDTLVDQIVADVLAQLRQRIDSAPTSSANPREREPSATANSGDVIKLSEAVVTAEVLEKYAGPGGSILLSPRSIVTPSARDYLKSHKIAVHREERNGRADGTGHPGRGTIIAAHLPAVVQSFLADAKRQSDSTWNVEIESGTASVVNRVCSVICRGEFQQAVVFVKGPSHVACLVNRNPKCRAAVVRNGADVRRVRAEFGPNVICVDLEQPTLMGLKDVLRICSLSAGLIPAPGNEG